jgi:hypoxanthine phosphoribosyltransferase
MRYVEDIDKQGDSIERKDNRPRLYRCPRCGTKGRRIDVVTRWVGHVRVLNRRSWIKAEVGVYKAKCGCCKYFQAPIRGVPYKGQYSYEVRNVVANSLIRDRMPYRLVQQRMAEDYRLELSVGYLQDCFRWAYQQIDTEEHWQFVLATFSGVMCVDEVHDSGQTILFATDPLNDFTLAFEQVETNDQGHMDAFLQRLKDRGLQVVVAITDGSPLYKDSLQSHWSGIAHQLCLFHVIKDVNKLILDGVRAVRNQIQRQGNKGRKRKPGRPTETARQQRQRRKGMTKKEQATFIWEHQYLIVRQEEELTEEDKNDLELMVQMAPDLELFRRFNQQFYRLFEKSITPQQARYRRTQMVNNPDYQANAFLARALKKLPKDKFEKMIVHLEWENVDATNNHVERNNRTFRMLQKTRYKRRQAHTLKWALELDLYARMLSHPLYPLFRQHKIVSLPLSSEKLSCLDKAV